MSRKIIEVLRNLPYFSWRAIFIKHLAWCNKNDRVSGSPDWYSEPGTINVIGIRCNNEVEFNHNKYDDYLVMIKNKPLERYDINIIKVTVDPAKDGYGRAHLSQGIYDAYDVGIHGLSSGNTTTSVKGKTYKRYALRQDRNKVRVTRTDGKGKVIKTEWGFFTINIHNTDDYVDSSLACTVVQTNLSWLEDFVPYIWDIENDKRACSNKPCYCLINHANLQTYLSEELVRVEKAQAENGTEGDTSGQSKPATKEDPK